MKITLNWMKCDSSNTHWCDLIDLNLNSDHFKDLTGVYLIWSSSEEKYIRLGSGIIKDRLEEHKNNKEILLHKNLKVTWASAGEKFMRRIEAYMANVCDPVIGERFPDVDPIEVNMPA